MTWNERTLRAEIEADMAEAARRRGAPTPDSEPEVEVEAVAHFSRSSVLRLQPVRRRIVRARGVVAGNTESE